MPFRSHLPVRPPFGRSLVVLALAWGLFPSGVLAQADARIAAGLGRIVPVGGFEQGRNRTGRPLRTTTTLRASVGWRWSEPGTDAVEAGVGVSLPRVQRTDELGEPTAIWAFSRIALVERSTWRASFTSSLGVTLGWRAFDPVENPRQTAIGAPVSAMFRIELGGAIRVREQFWVTGSAGYQHFSNGNLRPPNVGLNTLPISVGVAWRPESAARSPDAPVEAAPHARGGWRFRALPFVGARGIAADNRHAEQDAVYTFERFAVAGVHLQASRPLAGRWRWAAVVGLTGDRSGFRGSQVPELEDGPLRDESGWTVSAGLSTLLDMGPAELEFGVGVEGFDVGGVRDVTRLHQRLGAHLLLGDRLRPSVVLRALGFDRPHYVEWGLGIEL